MSVLRRRKLWEDKPQDVQPEIGGGSTVFRPRGTEEGKLVIVETAHNGAYPERADTSEIDVNIAAYTGTSTDWTIKAHC